MFLTTFLVLLVISMLVLYGYFQSRWESKVRPVFENYILSGISTEGKIRFMNILTYFANKRMLVQRIQRGLVEKTKTVNLKNQLPSLGGGSFLMFMAAAGEEVIVPGYDKVLGIINTILTFVFLIVVLSMFRNFIMGGITEAVYKFLHNASSETIDSIIRKLTIKSELDVLVKNSLESLKEARKKEETKKKT